MDHPMEERVIAPGTAVSRDPQRHEYGNMPSLSSTFPEGHIAGTARVGMGPAIPSHPDNRTIRMARLAGAGIGRASNLFSSTANLKKVRNLTLTGVRDHAADFVAGNPSTLIGAALAGYLLGRMLRR